MPKAFSGLGQSFAARLATSNVAVAKPAAVAGVKSASRRRGVVAASAVSKLAVENSFSDFTFFVVTFENGGLVCAM